MAMNRTVKTLVWLAVLGLIFLIVEAWVNAADNADHPGAEKEMPVNEPKATWQDGAEGWDWDADPQPVVSLDGTGWYGWNPSQWAQTCYDASKPPRPFPKVSTTARISIPKDGGLGTCSVSVKLHYQADSSVMFYDSLYRPYKEIRWTADGVDTINILMQRWQEGAEHVEWPSPEPSSSFPYASTFLIIFLCWLIVILLILRKKRNEQ